MHKPLRTPFAPSHRPPLPSPWEWCVAAQCVCITPQPSTPSDCSQIFWLKHTRLHTLPLSLSLSLSPSCSCAASSWQRREPFHPLLSRVTERVSGRGSLGSATQGARSLPDHQEKEQIDRLTGYCTLLLSVNLMQFWHATHLN